MSIFLPLDPYSHCGRQNNHSGHPITRNGANFYCPGNNRRDHPVSVEEIEGKGDPQLVPQRTLDNSLDELLRWWKDTTEGDIRKSIEKIREYGGSGAARDLIGTGRELASLSGRELSDQDAVELGIYFYLRSKLDRWGSAIYEGRTPSDDTIFDLSFYAMMARRNRAVGGWPFPPTGKDK